MEYFFRSVISNYISGMWVSEVHVSMSFLLVFQTIGAAFGAKKIEVDGKNLTMGIWVRF